MIQMLFSRQGVKELVINYKAQNVVEPKLFCLFLFFWERGVMFSNLEGVIDFFFFLQLGVQAFLFAKLCMFFSQFRQRILFRIV